MQTITTKYLGSTNYRGSRIKATTSSGISKTVSYKHELNQLPNHERAVHELNNKLGWTGEMVSGSPNDTGDNYIFVFIDGSDKIKLELKDTKQEFINQN
tara:strand:- start:63 stop:359 length:297 start_codon:yes stop_codon:yes gene_type:complete